MSKIKLPYDFLEDTQFLKTVIEDNIALIHNDYRPLEEFNKVMRDFGRDFLRNYLTNSLSNHWQDYEIEQLITDFEQKFYGTQPNKND